MAERPAVLLISHGSRQPHAAAYAHRVAATLRTDDPAREVAVSFLDVDGPAPGAALQSLLRRGADLVQVVPMLFSAGYHYRVDVPAALDAVRESHPHVHVRMAAPLLHESQTELVVALDARLRDASSANGRRNGSAAKSPDGLVLMAAGSSDPRARERVTELAHTWGRERNLPAEVAFCDLRGGEVRAAIALLRTRGVLSVACGALFLANGRLLEAASQAAVDAGAGTVAGPLGTAPALLELIRRRCLEPVAAG